MVSNGVEIIHIYPPHSFTTCLPLAMMNEKSYNNFNSHGGNNSGGVGGINSNGVHNNGSSVPLYRRQPMTGAGGNGGQNNYNNLPGLFAGLDTGTNLIEALFQANNAAVGDHASKSDPHNQSLLYNNYNALKNTHELDLFASVVPPPPPQQNSQVPPGAAAVVDNINHPQSSAAAATTYAAVLSQGPQQQPVQQQQQRPPLHAASKSSQPNNDLLEKDPFAAIRELGQATTGFYNYFQ